MLYKAEHAVAHLIKGRQDQAYKTIIKHLVCGLRLYVNMGGQDCDVGVRVVPADDPSAHTALTCELLSCRCTPRQLLWTGLHPILIQGKVALVQKSFLVFLLSGCGAELFEGSFLLLYAASRVM